MNTQERDFYMQNPHCYPEERFMIEDTVMLAFTWLIIIVAILLTLLYRFKTYVLILLTVALTLCSCCGYQASYNHAYGNQKKIEKSRKDAINRFNNGSHRTKTAW